MCAFILGHPVSFAALIPSFRPSAFLPSLPCSQSAFRRLLPSFLAYSALLSRSPMAGRPFSFSSPSLPPSSNGERRRESPLGTIESKGRKEGREMSWQPRKGKNTLPSDQLAGWVSSCMVGRSVGRLVLRSVGHRSTLLVTLVGRKEFLRVDMRAERLVGGWVGRSHSWPSGGGIDCSRRRQRRRLLTITID